MKIDEKIAQKITEAFIAGLEKGNIPWKKGWKTNGQSSGQRWGGFISDSINVQTKKHYNGINALLLDSVGLDVPVWGTFNQWKAAGLSVKKGEKAMPTIFWGVIFIDANGNFLTPQQWEALSEAAKKDCKKIFKLRYDNLFNITQVDGEKYDAILEKWTAKFKIPVTEKPTTDEPIAPEFHHEISEMIVGRWDVSVKNVKQDRAYYTPTFDQITMPLKSQFDSLEAYYETLFHEGIHATGHKSRQDRFKDGNTRFGSAEYSFEELIAEIGSAFVCAHLRIDQVLENKQAYINNWIQKLGQNPEWIIKASSPANKAAGWVLGWLDNTPTPEKTEVPESELVLEEA